jgi:hypothetical protein
MVVYTSCPDKPWEIHTLKETNWGFLCMSPDGETAFLTKEEHAKMTQRKNQDGKDIHSVGKSKV